MQLAWIKLFNQKRGQLPKSFCGTILTGWQRYDHFAALCELLPAGIPSLCCCLAALDSGVFGEAELARCSNELGFDLAADLSGRRLEASPNFPGWKIYVLMRRYLDLKSGVDQYLRSEVLQTWFSDFQLRRGRFSPLQLRGIQSNLERMLADFQELARSAQLTLSEVYPQPVCDEWLGTFVEPVVVDLTKNLEKAHLMLNM